MATPIAQLNLMAKYPFEDFEINLATLNYCNLDVNLFLPTKVYGDHPNSEILLPLNILDIHGIDETMSIDQCTH